MLNRVFGTMLEIAFARGGTLLKFGGDALLLLFDGPDHPVQAACAAVEMRAALRARHRGPAVGGSGAAPHVRRPALGHGAPVPGGQGPPGADRHRSRRHADHRDGARRLGGRDPREPRDGAPPPARRDPARPGRRAPAALACRRRGRPRALVPGGRSRTGRSSSACRPCSASTSAPGPSTSSTAIAVGRVHPVPGRRCAPRRRRAPTPSPPRSTSCSAPSRSRRTTRTSPSSPPTWTRTAARSSWSAGFPEPRPTTRAACCGPSARRPTRLSSLPLQIGVHHGHVVAGTIGSPLPRHLHGDGRHGEPGRPADERGPSRRGVRHRRGPRPGPPAVRRRAGPALPREGQGAAGPRLRGGRRDRRPTCGRGAAARSSVGSSSWRCVVRAPPCRRVVGACADGPRADRDRQDAAGRRGAWSSQGIPRFTVRGEPDGTATPYRAVRDSVRELLGVKRAPVDVMAEPAPRMSSSAPIRRCSRCSRSSPPSPT